MKQKIYTDESLKQDIRREINRVLTRCKALPSILGEYGYNVSRENVADCLTLKREQVTGEQISDSLNAMTGAVVKYQVVNKWVGCPNLERELAEKQASAVDGRYSPKRQHDELEALQNEFEVMLFRCNELMNPIHGAYINTSRFARWFDVEEGKIILSPQIEKLIEEEATIYCETKKAETALKLHRQAAEILSEFVALFPKSKQPDDIGDLFVIDGDIVRMNNINYNRYLL